MLCQVCEQPLPEENKHTGREMMFGLRECFDYYECAGCGCVQLDPVPPDLARFYPATYPAFGRGGGTPRKFSRLRMLLNQRLTWHQLGRPSLLGRLRALRPRIPFLPAQLFHAELDLTPASSILDVGCGNGALLFELARLGFENLTGTDLFAEPLNTPGAPKILSGPLDNVPGTFDLVMLHHSFEHMPAPRDTFKKLAALLEPDGRLLIRIPVADTYAWKHYGVNWVQLDPPRHLFLHTAESMRRLADHASLQITKTIHDSNGFQFWGSELYRRDLALTDPRAVWASPPNGPFTPTEMAEFDARARELNAHHDGDQAAFILRHR